MNIAARAKFLFGVGCVIGAAGAAQAIMALGAGRPLAAIMGIICVGVATSCCLTNWKLWHQD